MNIDRGPSSVIKLPDKKGLTIAPKAKVNIREEFNSAMSLSLQKSFACAALNEKIGNVAAPKKNIEM